MLLLVALFAPWIAPHAPDQTNSAAFLRPPAWQAGGSAQFLLGTDAIGRDILSRLIYGARLSLSIGMAVVADLGGGRHRAGPDRRLRARHRSRSRSCG